MVSSRYASKVAGIKGIKEARNVLDEVKKEILDGGEVAGPTLDKATDAMMGLIDARTPVDTGRLVTGNKKRKINNFAIVIYNEVPYAGFVHHGTSRMPARPFMEQGINEFKEDIPDIYVKNASDFIRKLEGQNKPA